jgi:hypothetical protein
MKNTQETEKQQTNCLKKMSRENSQTNENKKKKIMKNILWERKKLYFWFYYINRFFLVMTINFLTSNTLSHQNKLNARFDSKTLFVRGTTQKH